MAAWRKSSRSGATGRAGRLLDEMVHTATAVTEARLRAEMLRHIAETLADMPSGDAKSTSGI